MKFMTMALLALSFSAFAEGDGEMFKKHKDMVVANMEKRIGILQESKSCISAATNKDQLHACRQKMKESMKGIKDDSKEARAAMKAEFKANKEKKKAERKAKK